MLPARTSYAYEMIRSELTWVVGAENVQTDASEKLAHSIDYYWVPELWHDRGQELPGRPQGQGHGRLINSGTDRRRRQVAGADDHRNPGAQTRAPGGHCRDRADHRRRRPDFRHPGYIKTKVGEKIAIPGLGVEVHAQDAGSVDRVGDPFPGEAKRNEVLALQKGFGAGIGVWMRPPKVHHLGKREHRYGRVAKSPQQLRAAPAVQLRGLGLRTGVVPQHRRRQGLAGGVDGQKGVHVAGQNHGVRRMLAGQTAQQFFRRSRPFKS